MKNSKLRLDRATALITMMLVATLTLAQDLQTEMTNAEKIFDAMSAGPCFHYSGCHHPGIAHRAWW